MKLKKMTEERRALVSRLRTLCLSERILEGTVTRTRVGNSLRMTVTDKADGRTRTLFVPAARRLRKAFPRLPICLVGDALYDRAPVAIASRRYLSNRV